jgi:hypothetical protein
VPHDHLERGRERKGLSVRGEKRERRKVGRNEERLSHEPAILIVHDP